MEQPSGRGEDQEAGEGVTGAALARQHAVVLGCVDRHRVSGVQLQDRRAGGDQEPVSRVAQRHHNTRVLHQVQTNLEQQHKGGAADHSLNQLHLLRAFSPLSCCIELFLNSGFWFYFN